MKIVNMVLSFFKELLITLLRPWYLFKTAAVIKEYLTWASYWDTKDCPNTAADMRAKAHRHTLRYISLGGITEDI